MAAKSTTAKPRAVKAPITKRRVYLLHGPEEIRKRQALESLLSNLVPAEDRELDVQYIDVTNANVTGEMILHAARDRAMFSEQRVVVLLNAGRLRAPRHQRTQEVLAEGIGQLPDHGALIFMVYAEEDDRRKSPFNEKLMAALKACGEIQEFKPLRPDEMAKMAQEEAAAAGKQLTPPAAMMLAQRVAPDSQRMLQEVRKLASFVGDRLVIRPADVEQMVAAPPDDNLFHLLDATMEGNRAHALSLLRQLRESGTAVPQMLPMLGRSLRLVAQAKYLLEQRITSETPEDAVSPEILAELPEEGLIYRITKPGFGREKVWKQARAISWAHLHHALDRLAVTEAGFKGWDRGVEDADLGLELFVVGLCDTVKSQGPSRPAFRR